MTSEDGPSAGAGAAADDGPELAIEALAAEIERPRTAPAGTAQPAADPAPAGERI